MLAPFSLHEVEHARIVAIQKLHKRPGRAECSLRQAVAHINLLETLEGAHLKLKDALPENTGLPPPYIQTLDTQRAATQVQTSNDCAGNAETQLLSTASPMSTKSTSYSASKPFEGSRCSSDKGGETTDPDRAYGPDGLLKPASHVGTATLLDKPSISSLSQPNAHSEITVDVQELTDEF